MATLKANNRINDAALANRAVRQLDPTVKVRSTGITNFGAVARTQGQVGSLGMPNDLTFTLDNSGGVAAKGYRIGDGTDFACTMNGFAGTVVPDSSSGIPAAAFGTAVGMAPVAVAGINYSSTSGAVQFPQAFFFCMAEIDGTRQARPVNIAAYQRNTAQNGNLMTLQFDEPFVLDWNTGFYVLAGVAQVVNVTLMFGAVDNR